MTSYATTAARQVTWQSIAGLRPKGELFNDSWGGDNFFGKSSEIDVNAFKSSAEKENVGSDGLSYDSSSFDFMGRSMSAPAPTSE